MRTATRPHPAVKVLGTRRTVKQDRRGAAGRRRCDANRGDVLLAQTTLARPEHVKHALGIGETKLRELVRTRKLRPTYVGKLLRFVPDDVAAYVQSIREDA